MTKRSDFLEATLFTIGKVQSKTRDEVLQEGMVRRMTESYHELEKELNKSVTRLSLEASGRIHRSNDLYKWNSSVRFLDRLSRKLTANSHNSISLAMNLYKTYFDKGND